jgi:3-hydroxybutyryl-CoA dehydrogenase
MIIQMRVCVLGAGLMGAQIGVEYALGGHDVVLVARDLGRLEERVAGSIGFVLDHELRPEHDTVAARRRIALELAPRRAAAGADLLLESLPEDLGVKTSLLRAALEVAPDALVATNTSSLPIGELGDAIGAPERTVGTHYLNPPLLMPPVEVVAGDRTAPETVETLRKLLVGLGKTPVLVERDVPGFVWNRLQFALVRESVWLVEQGVASPETVDEVVRSGLARRWRHVGPMRAIALGGVDTWNRSGENIVPTLSRAESLPDLAAFALTGGDLAADARARDAALASEL